MREVKWHTGKYLFNPKESNGGRGEQKYVRYTESKHQINNANPIFSVITLDVSGLNIPIKRQRLMDKKI